MNTEDARLQAAVLAELGEMPSKEPSHPRDFRPQYRYLDAASMPEWYQHPKDDTEIRFVTFHVWNPHVYKGIVVRAFKLLNAGTKKFGIAMIYNNMRWENAVNPTQGEVYKLPNDFQPLYARLLIHHFPQFEGVVETRRRFKK